MRLFGLIGHPLAHSFSKKYFESKFKKEGITNCSYQLFDIENILDFNTIKNTTELTGLNVTIPYKQSIIEHLDEIDTNAKLIGAVNTIKIDTATKKTKGFNTDYYGFKNSLKPFLENTHQRALILGTGGASKAIVHVLKNLNIDCLFVSRTPKKDNEISYQDVNEYVIKHHQLIINTTPLGTYPNIESYPNISYENLTSNHLLYDLVYNPEETVFLKKGKEKGCLTINGLQMLKLQAEKSWEIWNS
ncbi:MAG: shikimate dehydrogenase [Vicingaceae bacterium]|nr:shikimate dehydrogenase [Vicingaceae bacterium]